MKILMTYLTMGTALAHSLSLDPAYKVVSDVPLLHEIGHVELAQDFVLH